MFAYPTSPDSSVSGCLTPCRRPRKNLFNSATNTNPSKVSKTVHEEELPEFFQKHMNGLEECQFPLHEETTGNAAWFSFMSSNKSGQFNTPTKLHVKVATKSDGDNLLNEAYVASKLSDREGFMKFVDLFVGSYCKVGKGENVPKVFKMCGGKQTACLAVESVPSTLVSAIMTRDEYSSPPGSPLACGLSYATQGPLSLKDTTIVSQQAFEQLMKSMLKAGNDFGFSHNDLHMDNVLVHGGKYIVIDYGRSYIPQSVDLDELKRKLGCLADVKYTRFNTDKYMQDKKIVVPTHENDEARCMYVLNDLLGLYKVLKTKKNISWSNSLLEKWERTCETLDRFEEVLKPTNGTTAENPTIHINEKLFGNPLHDALREKYIAEMKPSVETFISQVGSQHAGKKSSWVRKVYVHNESKKKFVVLDKKRVFLSDVKGKYRYTSAEKTHVQLSKKKS